MKPNQNGSHLPFKPMSVTVPLDYVGKGLEALAEMAEFERFIFYKVDETRYRLSPGCQAEYGPYITFDGRCRDDGAIDVEEFELPDCASLDTIAQIIFDRFSFWMASVDTKKYGFDDFERLKVLSVRLSYDVGREYGQLECRLTVPLTLKEEAGIIMEEQVRAIVEESDEAT